ncbi:MAG: kynureninase [Ekhidna sp.]|uniref:kynureninase n=1 Tax=Ekhidna sp. TaxID=2608089 RepID=UPI0032EC634C
MKEEVVQKARQLDAEDSLASFRSQFYFPQKNGKDCIYLCGNSLGLQPKTTSRYLDEELKKWKEHGVEGHFTGDKPWVSYHKNSKAPLAKIVGAHEHEVVAMNNLTTNLHLAMASFYQPKGKRTKILIERGAFPSDFYAVHSRIQVSGLDPKEHLIELNPADGSDYLSTEEILKKINLLGDELALVMFPGVQYYTGQFFNIQKITAAAHQTGAYAGFDLAHAVGNIPMKLHEHEVDFAVWCTYKYLNSGPGGVGGLYIHEKHGANKAMPRLSGWWGHDSDSRFKMANQINPIPTVDGWQLSNVNILSYAAHLASLQLFDEAGIGNLRAKSLKLTNLMEELILNSAVLSGQIKILTPSTPEERGAQLSLYLTNHGKSVFEYLIEQGVILDWREPNVIRVAPVPLYNTFEDVVNFVSILEDAIAHEG